MVKYLSIVLLAALFNNNSCPKNCVLIAKPTNILGCGGILYAGQYLFIDTKDTTEFIGVIKCPDGYGENFFKEDAKYNIDFSKDTILEAKYSWMNVFDYPPDKKIRIRIIEKIEEIKVQ